jgi:formiminotetrahydrofolate cyclodeaminase
MNMDHANASHGRKSIWDSSLRGFRDRTASREPTPGGGSVAAVAAAQGLALVLMALEISARRKEPHPEIAGLLVRGRALLEPLSACADDDIAAFEKYLAALRLPKATAAEQAARDKALAAANAHALEAPLRAADRFLDALLLARDAVRAVHSGIVTDVGAGAAILHGALTATLYNVDINLKGIADAAQHREALATRQDLQRRGDELAYVIQKETAAKI